MTGENISINRLKDISRFKSDRYAVSGFENDSDADDFILNLKNYVKNDSIMEISDIIYYPLNVASKNRKKKISDPESFIKDYNTIFNKRVKNSILKQPLADVKASSKGLSIGTGEIIINLVDGRIYITSVNSY